MNNLVIVESPTKARTLSRFLGADYQIEASMGHIRDLPKADIGVDVEHDFEPRYIIPKDKTKRANDLKKLALSAKTLWLATDPDREGEAIAWHIAELLRNSELKMSAPKRSKNVKYKIPEIKRVVFHEITPEAIKQAFLDPRPINLKLVDAQQGRRILDRLVGYKLSPLLWKKVKSGLSAGRVQSVALRLVVEREKDVLAFKSIEYWSIEAELQVQSSELRVQSFVTVLMEVNGKKAEIKTKIEADLLVKNLESAEYQVKKVNKKQFKRYPLPPFTTSTLQQTASNRLGMTAKKTMMLAQNLYEQGLITYMRTDSVNLATVAIEAARAVIKNDFGTAYLPAKPKYYQTKSKMAQEAHEAIRPTDFEFRISDIGHQSNLTRDHIRLYDLIHRRTLACQMTEALLDQTSIDVSAKRSDSYIFRATGSVVKFDGWLKLYQREKGKGKRESQDNSEEDKEEKNQEKILPEMIEGEELKLLQILASQHFTEPPARFNEASLIKKLEELGIGRPSTFAPILSTILERYYVEKKEKRFYPTELGNVVIQFLLKYFPEIIDYSFTAQMEADLDEVARGEKKWQPVLREFYTPFANQIDATLESAEKMPVVSEIVDEKCPNCGKNLLIKFGRFGKFLACSGFPDCKFTKPLEEKINIKCPDCKIGEVILRKTKKGRPFYGCSNYPKCNFASWNRPKSEISEKT